MWLLVTPWTTVGQASLSITSPAVCSKSWSLSWWCHPTISSSVAPFFSCPQSFPSSWSFPKSQLFASGTQSIRASASTSVLPMNIRTWFPWGLTRLISLQSKGLYGSAPQFKSIHSLALSLLYGPSFSVHDCWKNHSFDNAYRPLSAKWCFIMCCLGLS